MNGPSVEDVERDIASFNDLVNQKLPGLLADISEVDCGHDDDGRRCFLRLSDPEVCRPKTITGAPLMPLGARLANLTYASDVTVRMALVIDGVEDCADTVLVGRVPTMLRSESCHLAHVYDDGELHDAGGYFIVKGTEFFLNQPCGPLMYRLIRTAFARQMRNTVALVRCALKRRSNVDLSHCVRHITVTHTLLHHLRGNMRLRSYHR